MESQFLLCLYIMAQTSNFLSVFLEPQASWPCFVERAFCAISVPDDSDSDADVGTEGQTFGPVGQHSRCPTSLRNIIYSAAAAQGFEARLPGSVCAFR